MAVAPTTADCRAPSNGTRAEVAGVDQELRTVSLQLGDGTKRTIDSSYLDDGWLDHAYALTAHAAQGATVDRSFVLGSDELYREWGYTALSRHRAQARFYVVSPGSVERALPGLEADRDVVSEDVVAMLSPSHRKELALDVADRAGARNGQRVRQDAQREIEAALKRIEALRAEQAELGRLRRSRRAALGAEIAQQEQAVDRWSAHADAMTIAAVSDRPAPAIPREAPDADRSLTRAALVERDATLTRALGDVPSGFVARERWMQDAASVVSATALVLDMPTMSPDIDDLGMEF